MNLNREYLTIALPKGKLGDDAIRILAAAGYAPPDVKGQPRKLLFDDEARKLRYIICRPTDIPAYVDYGAADVGIVGKDTIVESNKDIFELLDLRFGQCRFMVAMPRLAAAEIIGPDGKAELSRLNHKVVATKFPRVAEMFFKEKGMQVEVIKLHGNIELAPIVGLSDMIVDIVSTGGTLRENDLVPICEIFEASSRLIANKVSFRTKHGRVQELLNRLKTQLQEEER